MSRRETPDLAGATPWPAFAPHPLREYAVLADGERGALVGPGGDIAFLCVPRWHDEAMFSALLGGAGTYTVQPAEDRCVWGGSYLPGTLAWKHRWVVGSRVVECRDALAFPGLPDRAVLLRRVSAVQGEVRMQVVLQPRPGFGRHAVDWRCDDEGVWVGRGGGVWLRWTGGSDAEVRVGDTGSSGLRLELTVPNGEDHDLVLEMSTQDLPGEVPCPAVVWTDTHRAWHDVVPSVSNTLAPRDVRHSLAVISGLTSNAGGMVAAATTSLPERAERGRDYDYRYSWIRDQCMAGQALAAVGAQSQVARAVDFVAARLEADGDRLRPAYTVTGSAVPETRGLGLPGYPGAPDVRVGNRVRDQFQLDVFGEVLLLFAAADRCGVLDDRGWHAVDIAVDAIVRRHQDADAGIWEVEPRRWAHSRLTCAAGLRAVAGRRADRAANWVRLADLLTAGVARECRHPSGRWQRAPDDPRVDAALLLAAVRGAVPADHPRSVATWRAVASDLAEDGYVYRFRHQPGPLRDAEGAFLLCGFIMALASHQQGDAWSAVRWFERARASVGPPGLFTEEYDVEQRQPRGNLPQAFVHALLIETAAALVEPAPDRPPSGGTA